jgi:hypothetical protein
VAARSWKTPCSAQRKQRRSATRLRSLPRRDDAALGASSAADAPFPVGALVAHAEWGEGAVQRYDGGQMTVLFDSVGCRTLSVELVVDGNLLTLCG